MSQVGRKSEIVWAQMCVSAVRAMEVPGVFVLRSSCGHVTEIGGP